jgi:hypothetical protein
MHLMLMVIKLKAWNYDKTNQTIAGLLFVSSLNEKLLILEMVLSFLLKIKHMSDLSCIHMVLTELLQKRDNSASMLSRELDWTKSWSNIISLLE